MTSALPEEVAHDPLSWPSLDWALGTQDRTQAHTNNLVIDLRFPAGSAAMLHTAVSGLVHHHPTLRTSYLQRAGSAGTQVLRRPPDPAQLSTVLELRDVGPAELFDEREPHSFDLARELPFTVVAAVGDRTEIGLRLTVDHIATDWHGVEILAADLRSMLSGEQPGVPGLSPQDLSRWESSAAGRDWNSRKIRGWQSVFDVIDGESVRGTGRLGPTPRQSPHQLLEHELFCPGLGMPITVLADCSGTFASAVVLSCIVGAHQEIFEQSLFVGQALSANRWSPKGRRSSAKLLMQGPVAVRTTSPETRRLDQLRATHRSLFRAMSMAYVNPADVVQTIRDRGLSSIPGVLGVYYNFNVVEPPSIATIPTATLSHRANAGHGPGIAYTVHHSREHLMISLRHAPETMTPAQAGDVLRCVHRLLCLEALGRPSHLEEVV